MCAVLQTLFPVELPAGPEPLFESVEHAAVLAAAYLFGSKSEFFVVHALTSLHAIIVTMQYLPAEMQRAVLAHWLQTALVVLSTLDFVGSEAAEAAITEWKHASESSPADDAVTEDNADWWQAALDKSQMSSEEHLSKAVFVLWRFHSSDMFSPAAKQLFFKVAEQQVRDSESGHIEDNIWFK